MSIRQITIIGTGLIGGSFGLALKKSGFSGRIVGCDRAPVLEQALKIGTIDSAQTDPIEAVRGSQLILLAVPVGAIIELIGRLGPALLPDALLTDTGRPQREAGGGALREMTRISASPYGIWRDVVLTNKKNVGEALLKLEQKLAHIRENLDTRGLEEEFERAHKLKKVSPGKHGGAGN